MRMLTPSLISNPELIACVKEAASHPDFVREFDRLTGSCLSAQHDSLTRLIDLSTGYYEASLRRFIEFVYEHVYLRLQQEPAA